MNRHDGAYRISVSLPAFCGSLNGRKPSPGCEETREVIGRLIEEGFGLEVRLLEPEGTPLDEEAAARLRELCEPADTLTAHTSVYGWEPPRLRGEIRLAAAVGAAALAVHPVRLGLDEQRPDFAAVRDLCAEARDAGVTLLLENVPSGLPVLRRALDEVGWNPRATGLGILVDLGHANLSKTLDGVEPARFLRELRHVIIEVHLHDNDGEIDQHRLPGEGTLDWAPLLAELRRLPKSVIHCMELGTPGAAWESLRQARRFLLDGLAAPAASELE